VRVRPDRDGVHLVMIAFIFRVTIESRTVHAFRIFAYPSNIFKTNFDLRLIPRSGASSNVLNRVSSLTILGCRSNPTNWSNFVEGLICLNKTNLFFSFLFRLS
jgi:hypothetical protein